MNIDTERIALDWNIVKCDVHEMWLARLWNECDIVQSTTACHYFGLNSACGCRYD